MHPSLTRLRALMKDMGSVLVAFSGGIDSAVVLKVATDVLGDRAVGLTAVGPALAQSERKEATRLAADMGARHVLVESGEIERPGYVANGPDRCFHCKSELYRITTLKRSELGLDWVANGTNRDDLGDYRPGLEAARDSGVRSPLVEAGLGKSEVRAIARELGMDIWDKPASACLSSRIPYGTTVTRERLGQIERAEAALRDLGLVKVRVRHHGELARIEVSRDQLVRAFELRDELTRIAKAAGFAFVTLDLEGYRVGSHNVLLPLVD